MTCCLNAEDNFTSIFHSFDAVTLPSHRKIEVMAEYSMHAAPASRSEREKEPIWDSFHSLGSVVKRTSRSEGMVRYEGMKPSKLVIKLRLC